MPVCASHQHSSSRFSPSDCSVASSTSSVPTGWTVFRSWFRQLNHHLLIRSPIDLESSNSLLTCTLDGTPTSPTVSPSRFQLPDRCKPACLPLAPGSDTSVVWVFLDIPRMRSCILAPSSHWISFLPSPIVFSMFFLLWIVLHVVDLLLLLVASFHPPARPAWRIYSFHPLPSTGVIVSFSLFLL